MNRKSILLTVSIILILSLTLIGNTLAGGIDNFATGTRAISMGCSYVGIADDASAVYHNPGGLAFIENDTVWMEGYTWISFSHMRYTGPLGEEESDDVNFVPGTFISKSYEKWSFGYGIYCPFATGGMSFDNFQGTNKTLEYAMGYLAFTPAVAYKVNSKFSIGLGFSLFSGMMESNAPNINTYVWEESEYDNISAGYGASIGLMYKPTSQLSVGLRIESEVPISLDGTIKNSNEKMDARMEFTTPYTFALGLGYKPSPQLMVSIAADYTLWGDMDEIEFKVNGVKNNVQTHYQHCWTFGTGMEYRLKNDIALTLGIYYTQGGTKKEGLSAANIDTDIVVPDVGIAYNINDSIEISLVGFYIYGFEEKYNSQKFSQEDPTIMIGIRYQL